MDCIEKYLYDTAKELYDYYLADLPETDYDYISYLAYNAGDNLSASILSNLESILEEKEIKIHV